MQKFSHEEVIEALDIAGNTWVDWRGLYSKVASDCFSNKETLRGEEIVVWNAKYFFSETESVTVENIGCIFGVWSNKKVKKQKFFSTWRATRQIEKNISLIKNTLNQGSKFIVKNGKPS